VIAKVHIEDYFPANIFGLFDQGDPKTSYFHHIASLEHIKEVSYVLLVDKAEEKTHFLMA
jgi:hypothetical protein